MNITEPFTGTPEEKQAVLDRIRERVQAIVDAEGESAQKPAETQQEAASAEAAADDTVLRVGDITHIITTGDPVYIKEEGEPKRWYFDGLADDVNADEPITQEAPLVDIYRQDDGGSKEETRAVAFYEILPPQEAAKFDVELKGLIARYDQAKAVGDTDARIYRAQLLEQYVAFAEISTN